MNIIIENIKNEINNNLYGSNFQKLMMPSNRNSLLIGNKMQDSAVMVLLFFNNNNELATCIIKRSIYNGNHSGQMALPGGKYEFVDKNLLNTAIRETYEEVGLQINDYEVLGQLTPLMIPISNILVSPFVSFIDYEPKFNINYNEVQQIYLPTISSFLNTNNLKIKIEEKNNTKTYIPYYNIENESIWGATAMIMSEFCELYKLAI
jgi:8-oxo-dGTP pyrophosphatase MutT (NUDIX family)